jgi:hypothetical protein
MLAEPIDRCQLWPASQAADRHRLTGLGHVDHDRRDAGEMHVLALQDAECDTAGDARIDRIATGLQDLEARLRREVVGGRNHMSRSDDTWMMCGHTILISHLYGPSCGVRSTARI